MNVFTLSSISWCEFLTPKTEKRKCQDVNHLPGTVFSANNDILII